MAGEMCSVQWDFRWQYTSSLWADFVTNIRGVFEFDSGFWPNINSIFHIIISLFGYYWHPHTSSRGLLMRFLWHYMSRNYLNLCTLNMSVLTLSCSGLIVRHIHFYCTDELVIFIQNNDCILCPLSLTLKSHYEGMPSKPVWTRGTIAAYKWVYECCFTTNCIYVLIKLICKNKHVLKTCRL